MLAIAVGMAAPDEVGVGTGDVALEGVDGMVGVLEAVDDTLTGVLTETEGTEGVELGGLMLLTGDVELDAPEEVLWELEAALLADELPETDELEVLRRKSDGIRIVIYQQRVLTQVLPMGERESS